VQRRRRHLLPELLPPRARHDRRVAQRRKAIIPIFYNIKPSDLILPEALADSDVYQPREL
jgi:hypothetical protein